MFIGKDIYMLWYILDSKSQTETARVLNISQPAVSQFLSKCRSYYEDQLIDFKTKTLTHNGDILKGMLYKAKVYLEYL